MKTITKISENKKNKNRVSIYADEEFLLACDKELIYKRGLKKGMQIDPEILLELAKEDTFIRARETALRVLERTMKTEEEVQKKLREKEYDERYAELYLKEKLRSRGQKKAKLELLQKGIDKEILNQALDSINHSNIEEETCLKLARKKYAQLSKREQDPYKLKSKLYTFLVGKGYDYELIGSTLRKILTQEEDY
jgi:regulatory protein